MSIFFLLLRPAFSFSIPQVFFILINIHIYKSTFVIPPYNGIFAVTLEEGKNAGKFLSHMSVSYTHLDVYKRQIKYNKTIHGM